MNLIELNGITKVFQPKNLFGKSGVPVTACNDITLAIRQGETLGIVGESGSGKSTLGRIVLGLEEPTSGNIRFPQHPEGRAQDPSHMQVIFQDPYSSLNPLHSALKLVMEPLLLVMNRQEARDKAISMLERVHITGDDIHKLPREFSGGQRQRIAIARAVSTEPEFIVCDEAVSALDVSIQAQIINILLDLQDQLNLTYLFISHDLSIVRSISHRIAVMAQGTIVEIADTEELFKNPMHPYTRQLLAAIPVADPKEARERRQHFDKLPQESLYFEGQWEQVNERHSVLKRIEI